MNCRSGGNYTSQRSYEMWGNCVEFAKPAVGTCRMAIWLLPCASLSERPPSSISKTKMASTRHVEEEGKKIDIQVTPL
jgi:hypothetical protein